MQRRSNGAKVPNELAVKVSESQESLNLLSVSGSRPRTYRLDCLQVHADLSFSHHITQEGNLGDMKLAFLSPYEELVVHEPLKGTSDLLDVCLKVGGEYEDVNQIHKN